MKKKLYGAFGVFIEYDIEVDSEDEAVDKYLHFASHLYDVDKLEDDRNFKEVIIDEITSNLEDQKFKVIIEHRGSLIKED